MNKNCMSIMNVKRISFLCVVLILNSCGSVINKTSDKPLFEVLTQQEDGGASIRFFEILSEPREIKMLLNDDNLRNKIKSKDSNTCNFVILNLGEKNSKGFSIDIKSIEETTDKIIIQTQESSPKTISSLDEVYFHPYTIVKVNSKKEIEIK